MHIKNNVCLTAKKTDEDFVDLRDHPPVCPSCEETFNFRYQLEWHYQWKHRSEGGLFLCNICNASFPTGADLEAHGTALHDDNSKHACEKCNKRFDTDLELRRHHLGHTRPQIPYMCDKCVRSFADRLSLERHAETHVEEDVGKRLSCNGCFTRKSYNVKHAKPRRIDCAFLKSVQERFYAHRTYKSM